MHVPVYLTDDLNNVKDIDMSTAAYCLSLHGKTKEGALRAFYKLEEDGLGKVLEVATSKGSQCVSAYPSRCMCRTVSISILT